MGRVSRGWRWKMREFGVQNDVENSGSKMMSKLRHLALGNGTGLWGWAEPAPVHPVVDVVDQVVRAVDVGQRVGPAAAIPRQAKAAKQQQKGGTGKHTEK